MAKKAPKKVSEMSYLEQQQHIQNMNKGLGEIFGKQQQPQMRVRQPQRQKRNPVSMGIGVIVAGLIMAIANSSLPEGETIGAGVGFFALFVGLVVAAVLAKKINM